MSFKNRVLVVATALHMLFACGDTPPKRATPARAQSQTEQLEDSTASQTPTISRMQQELAAQAPVQPGAPTDTQRQLSAAVNEYFQRSNKDRYYLHLDKPLYKPGETIWFRLWELSSAIRLGNRNPYGTTVQLISPKGAQVLEKRIPVNHTQPNMTAANDFVLPDSVQGGEYTLRVTSDQGGTAERKVIVSQYQAPRIKKKMEFLRKAYGAGDQVVAAISIHRATGEVLAKKPVTAVVHVDSAEVARFKVVSNSDGNATVKFTLPDSIHTGDGLLTLLVDDGGITESVQKRIPITLNNIAFEMFPEGGDLVTALPSRIYFAAKNSMGKPADVQGHIEDSQGKRVAEFRSFHNGMGRYEFTPAAGERYVAVIDKPINIKERFALPTAHAQGCTIQSVDDYNGERNDIRVGVWCSTNQSIIGTAVLREKSLGDISVDVSAGNPNVLSFPMPIGSQGAVRITLFSNELKPIAERLIYRGRGQDLAISVAADRDSYSPRDQVQLTITAKDLAGKPVEADLSLAVVDDTVLSFADDKTAHMLSRLYLESEMPGQEIEEPNFYFSKKSKAAPGLDFVLGTQGWRRFAWQQIFAPAAPSATEARPADLAAMEMNEGKADDNMRAPKGPRRRDAEKLGKNKIAPNPAAPIVAAGKPKPAKAARQMPMIAPGQIIARKKKRAMNMAGGADKIREERALEDEDWEVAARAEPRMAWAVHREFPAPNYSQRYDGPRHDFRETIHWQPQVRTNAAGTTTVRFYLNDAITSFRVHTEGVSQGGLPGRVEHLITSKLPISLATKMPLEVSKGDEIELPVTLTNETNRTYEVRMNSLFGPAFQVRKNIPSQITLNAGEKSSFFATLSVIGDGNHTEDGLMQVAIDTANLRDEVKRNVRVVPLGFPQDISISGTVSNSKNAVHTFTLSDVIPDTITANVTMYPSPLATMLSGTQAIIREPYGCFEQASSANYPNVMVLNYLEQNDAVDPALIESTMDHLHKGYKMLTGYESPKKGYEWFGGDPGHEALTAYGLMEFVDMAKVYGDVDQGMIRRTTQWLKSRRDGKGGFKQNTRALDSFGRASAEVTNAYISYALSQSGDTDLAAELAGQKKIAQHHSDPYVIALAANTLATLEPTASTTKNVLKKLSSMQNKEGAFSGADHSITRSGGLALELETTSLAVLALLRGGEDYTPQIRNAVEWLNKNRDGTGGFGSTQSTVLTLSALSSYAQASRVLPSSGEATIIINGQKSGTLRFDKGQKKSLVFDDIAAALKPGENKIELRLKSEGSLPYSLGVQYRSKMPNTSPESAVAVYTKLAKTTVPAGEGVRMNVSVKNLTDKGQPMTLARVGLPGGLRFQTWQLKELMDKKVIDFYETREREVVLYFRSLGPTAEVNVPLELLANVPGNYVAPASQAYLYYTDEFRHWAPPVRVTIEK